MQWILLLIILCVIAYFIPDRKDKNVEDRIYTIPDGDEKIQVLGSEYRPARRNYKQLREEHGDTFMIAFAPPSDYQLARGWPREPFLNVVRVGERLSRKDNWMGYVTPEAGIDIPAIYDHHRGLIRAVGDGSYKAQILLRYWNESGHNKHYSAVDVFKL